MFDNTLAIVRNGVTQTLTKINEQNGSSQYRFRDATQDVNLYIRHSVEKPLSDGRQMERHNYVYERTVFGTPTTLPVLESTSVTIRFQKGSDPVEAQRSALAGLTFASSANVPRLLAGES